MHIRVGADIRVELPSKTVIDWCANNLVLSNPDYYKLLRLGKWTGNTPKELYLYEIHGDKLCLPFGCLKDLYKLLGGNEEWNPTFEEIRSFEYGSNIELFDYQQVAVENALKAKNGILVMPCGSGKTQCGLEIIARLGGRALWLTHTQDLLNQSKKRAESVFDDVGIGTITEGKVNLGNGITFATVQTMSHLDLIKYRDFWDIIIVDECQHCAGTPTKVTQFYKVITNLKARYKIGLTATPTRADGLDRAMFALLGNTIHEVSREEVANTTCPISVLQIPTGWYPSDDDDIFRGDGTIDYMKVIDSLTHNQERFELVARLIDNYDCCIVLANRVEYLQRLQASYPKESVCLSGLGTSKKAKQERKEALRKLNDGEIQCIFATYQLAKEGLDVPNLRYIILATPEKDETTIIQSAGRVGRKAEGKDNGCVIDFVDDFGMYKQWSRKRMKYYKQIGAAVAVIGGGDNDDSTGLGCPWN